MSRHLTHLMIAAALGVGVAACGSSSSTSSSAPAATSSSSAASSSSSAAAPAATGSHMLMIAANQSGSLMFTMKDLTAAAGTVTIMFTNNSPVAHNLTVQKGTNGAVLGATPTFQGGTKTLTLKLTPGSYTYYCSVPGHRAAGMQGTLTVK